MTATGETTTRGVSAVLFLCLFAGQAALIALAPILAEVARELEVSTAAAGQLRTVAGLAAGTSALALGRVAGRAGLGRLLLAGAALLALGSLGAAASPTLTALALAQVPLGLGVGIVTTAGTLAAAEWVAPEQRTRVLSWALVGQPAAWIVGMPLAGVLGGRDWRLAWLVLPLASAVLAGVALLAAGAARRPAPGARAETVSMRAALADRGVARWLTAEALANSAWAGTLVFSGALFVESHGTSSATTGVVLAVAAVAYVAGNLLFRRRAGSASPWAAAGLLLALALLTTLFGALRPSVAVSAVLLSAAGFAAGARTLASGARGLALAPAVRPAALGMRAASMQLGYFAGSSIAGAALAAGGYTLLGIAVGALFLAAAAVLAPLPGLYRALRRPATGVGSTTGVHPERGAPEMNHAHILHTTMRPQESSQSRRRREELVRQRAELDRERGGRIRRAAARAWSGVRPGRREPVPAAAGRPAEPAIALRLATVRDAAVLRQLAALEGRELPEGGFVVAEVEGKVVAAHPLAGGEPLADPFRASASLRPLLRVRAEQLAASEAESRRGRALRIASLVRS